MSANPWKWIGWMVFAAATTVFFCQWSTPPRALAAPAKDAKVKALLQERLKILREAATVTSQAFTNGVEPFTDVMAANQAVRAAELELCTTDQERVALLEKMVAEAKEYEVTAAEQTLRGAVPAASSLRAKANRLEREIALERARNP